MNKTLLELPLLYGKTKQGKRVYWKGIVLEEPDKTICTKVYHGYTLEKMQEAITYYKQGKNIGKKNETTPLKQGIAELKRKWLDKKEKSGYVELDGEEYIDHTIYPMLCSTYKKWKNEYCNYRVQPKLDGVRCLVEVTRENVVFRSRSGGLFSMDHLVPEIRDIFTHHQKETGEDRLILDGELYSRELPFERVVGMIRKSAQERDYSLLSKIHYHTFDIVQPQPFEERMSHLEHLFSLLSTCSSLHYVETEKIQTEEELNRYYKRIIKEGYEGVILRNPKGEYISKHRSRDVLKWKKMKEDEYMIVGFQEGVGKDAGTVIWTCEIPETKDTFKVRPRGSYEYRKELFKNASSYLGKQLTVIYQELTRHGIPRFPVGKSIREGE